MGPNQWAICLKIAGSNCQSDRCLLLCDSASAITYSTPGRCCAVKWMFFFRHHIHRSPARCTKLLDTVPPRLLIYATTVVLSDLRRTCILFLDLAFNQQSRTVCSFSLTCLAPPLPGGVQIYCNVCFLPQKGFPFQEIMLVSQQISSSVHAGVRGTIAS